jgi:hypothetical protein
VQNQGWGSELRTRQLCYLFPSVSSTSSSMSGLGEHPSLCNMQGHQHTGLMLLVNGPPSSRGSEPTPVPDKHCQGPMGLLLAQAVLARHSFSLPWGQVILAPTGPFCRSRDPIIPASSQCNTRLSHGNMGLALVSWVCVWHFSWGCHGIRHLASRFFTSAFPLC